LESHFNWIGELRVEGVEEVSDVLESEEDGVSLQGEYLKLQRLRGRVGVLPEELVDDGWVNVEVGVLLWSGLFPVGLEEVLGRLVLDQLECSLVRCFLLSVEDLQEVGGRHHNSLPEFVLLVEGLSHASAVVVVQLSVLHQLDSSLLDDWASLWAGVHDSHLELLLLDGDAGLDGVVVPCDVLSATPFPGGSVVEDTFLHLQAIGVSVEGVLVVDVEAVEVDSDLLSFVWVRHAVDDNLPFGDRQVVDHDYLRKCLLSLAVLEVQGHLRSHWALLGDDLGQLAVSGRVVGLVLWSEDVVSALLAVSLVGRPVSQVEWEVEQFIVVLLHQAECDAKLCIDVLEGKHLQVALNSVTVSFSVVAHEIFLAVGYQSHKAKWAAVDLVLDVQLAVVDGLAILNLLLIAEDSSLVSLFEDSLLLVEDVHSVVGMGNSKFDVLDGDERGVVHSDDHLGSLSVLGSNGAVQVSGVLLEAPLPGAFWLDACNVLSSLRHDVRVNLRVKLETLVNCEWVVISYSLFASACDGIMMLGDSNGVEYWWLGIHYLIILGLSEGLVQHLESVELVWSMGELGDSSDVFLVIRSAWEISSPETVFIVSIGEHVIVLGGPFNVQLIHSINVHSWSGVQQSDVWVLLVEERNESVDGGEELPRILVVEVLSHRDEEVVSLVMVFLMDNPVIEGLAYRISIVCF
jgi:hypothetical protein